MATAAIGGTAQAGPYSNRARRTEAMPKASLFGSLLEMQSEEDNRSIKDIDPKTVRVPKTPTGKGPGQRFTLSEDVKNQLPGAAVLEKSKREFETQRKRVQESAVEQKKREEALLYKQIEVENPTESRRAHGTAHSQQWISEKDLKGAKDINILGLNQNQSFNRDKYGQKPPVHNYSNIGDILRPGMDFLRRERTDIQMRNLGYGAGDKRGILASPPISNSPSQSGAKSARSPRKSTIEVPPNIKHQFGSKMCDKLLSDKDVVEKTIRDQAQVRESIQRRSKPFTVPEFTKEMNPEYEMLSNSMRMNVVPGYTINHKTTTTKSTFNDQVHLFRHQDPDKWRYQKDELSKWRESRFMQIVLSKGLDNILNKAPKFERVAHDRSEAKTAPAPTTRRKKQQAPPKPKTAAKKESPKGDPLMEDFKFETPPTTPPPERVPVVAKTASRDNEFWDFYEKGGTK